MTLSTRSPVPEGAPPRRYAQLDALRGIAALVVVLGHMARFINDDGKTGLFLTPLSPYVTGHQAVIVFFVLSGFVLSLPYLSGSSQPYLPFIVRRVCRLYVPFAVAVLGSMASLYLLHRFAFPPLTGGTPASSWNNPLSARAVASDLVMLGYTRGGLTLDPPIWSLIVEMRASLLFPLLVLLTIRTRWLGVLLGVGSARIKAGIGDDSPIYAISIPTTILLTGRYLIFFLFGIMCAMRMQSISVLMRRIPSWVHVGLVACWIVLTGLVAWGQLRDHVSLDLGYGLLAVYLIACCVTFDGVAKVLLHRWCQWLGRVSFSLYLIHWPILLTAFYLLSRKLPQLGVLAAAFPAIFLGAYIMEHWVEQPSHRLGKRLSRRIEATMKSRLTRGDPGPAAA